MPRARGEQITQAFGLTIARSGVVTAGLFFPTSLVPPITVKLVRTPQLPPPQRKQHPVLALVSRPLLCSERVWFCAGPVHAAAQVDLAPVTYFGQNMACYVCCLLTWLGSAFCVALSSQHKMVVEMQALNATTRESQEGPWAHLSAGRALISLPRRRLCNVCACACAAEKRPPFRKVFWALSLKASAGWLFMFTLVSRLEGRSSRPARAGMESFLRRLGDDALCAWWRPTRTSHRAQSSLLVLCVMALGTAAGDGAQFDRNPGVAIAFLW